MSTKIEIEDNSHTCWFCRQTIESKDIHKRGTNPKFADYGYCYCRDCFLGFRESLEEVFRGAKKAKRWHYYWLWCLYGIVEEYVWTLTQRFRRS